MTTPAARLPNLIIPGAGKSGTSSLHLYLAEHPDIYMSPLKEPHFFSREDIYGKGAEWYASLFSSSQGEKILGESSTSYFHFPHVVERIAATLSEVKFIVLLRNPIDRAESHFRWMWSLGLESRSFRDAISADKNDAPDIERREQGTKTKFYFAESSYGTYLSPFFETFGASSIHVMSAEALISRPRDELECCFRFLEVSDFKISLERRENPTKEIGQPRLTAEDRRWFAQLVAPEVEAVRSLTGLSFEEWSEDFPS